MYIYFKSFFLYLLRSIDLENKRKRPENNKIFEIQVVDEILVLRKR